MLDNSEKVIEVSALWKIFGKARHEALAAIRRGSLSKAEVLEKYDCVVGVHNVTFSVGKGEIFCVMGLSGSGKSTLVRLINRLLSPTAGKVLIDGMDVTQMDDASLMELRNRRVAMIFQHFGLLPHRSVRDNVAMPLEIRGVSENERWEVADRVLRMVQLHDWQDRFAHELSGGMQQRVGLARAIAADPDVLLMDEPFSALDPLIRRQLQDEFMQLSEVMNKTTIFITHDLDEAIRIGDRVAIMKDGAIVQIGTPEEIVTHPADDYVTDFVAGISRVNLIRAHSIMVPVAEFEQRHGALPADIPSMHEEATLGELIRTSVERDGPILITGSDGHPAGVVSRDGLLASVMAGNTSE
ncbi:MAG: betaine/proline/choline family ABC transporter ATP-binding protein [Gammaproteobacteria bacterium]|nr:betaine/proline/choline family ABC transporter ATP-binding protein [Gammaproteobacteria bacterium]MCY4227315.1 betaine/proline/choline family ABC transporter ATP-binding protein [Gammaproteobacteria bacterium]